MRNFTRTKNLFLSLMLVIFSSVSLMAQVTLPHHDAIDYVAGNSLSSQSGWVSMNTGDSLLITSGNLDYSGLVASSGNKFTFDGAGIDAAKLFTQQTAGTVYSSFIMNVTALGTLEAVNGGYFFGFTEGTTTTFGASVWTKPSGAGFSIGLSARTALASQVWSSELPLNTPVLVVVAYEMVSGASNDIVKLWVNPIPGAAEPAVTLTATNTAGTDLANVNRIFIRQDSSTETPSIEMDEIRIGTSFADVTPAGVVTTLVTGITVSGAADATTITTAGGTLQMSAAVLPVDATDNTVTWSVVDGTGHATINSTGLLTAILDGTVTVTATANDASGISGSLEVTLSNQNPPVLVSGITVSGENGVDSVVTYLGTLQMIATVVPDSATNQNVTWSVKDSTGTATISATGLLTAATDGIVLVIATANDGSGIADSLVVTLSNQAPTLVSSITVSGAASATTITTYHGTLQMSADVLPLDATDATVVWSVLNGTGTATISATGLLTAATDGIVTVIATANDGSGIADSLEITLSNQVLVGTSIHDIQYSLDGASPLVGQTINLVDVVVTAAGTAGYYVQDAEGAWNGVYVYENVNKPVVGDKVSLTALVAEFNGLTELTTVTNFTKTSSGNPVAVAVVTAAQATTEAYEGVLVQVKFATCTVAPVSGTWTVNDGTADVKVYKTLYDFTSATVNSMYDITGVMTWYNTGSIYELLPRSVADVVTSTSSSENDITAFSLTEQSVAATIDATAHTVTAQVFSGVSLTALTPSISVSAGATITPATGVAQDFTNPVSYTVKAQDGTTQVWTVTVTVSSTLNAEAEIVSFTVANQIGTSVINSTAGTVAISVYPNADVTAITPTIGLSVGATIDKSGAQDFSSPVSYVVTAQDTTVKKTWTVTITKKSITTINAIQNSTGDSPLKGQVVATTGTVAGIKDYNSTSGLLMGYFIQSGKGAFSGVYVESTELFAVGDSVIVVGTVDEKYSFTYIKNATGNLVQIDRTVFTNTVTVAEANSESYESCLVIVEGPVVSVPDTYGTWVIGDGTTNVNVDDVLLPLNAFDALTFTVGGCKSVKGFMYYSYSKFNVLPTNISDVTFCSAIDEVTINNIDLYPNPVNSTLNINNIKDFSSIKVSNLLGQEVANVNVENANVQVNFEGLNRGIYFVSLFNNNELVKTYKVVKN